MIRPDVDAAIKQAARDLVAPQIAAMVDRAKPFFQPIYDMESPLIFGRVAIIGDAAYVARPHPGAGVSKAALDAATLADAIEACGGDLAAALARFERQRQPFGCGAVALRRTKGLTCRPSSSRSRSAPAGNCTATSRASSTTTIRGATASSGWWRSGICVRAPDATRQAPVLVPASAACAAGMRP